MSKRFKIVLAVVSVLALWTFLIAGFWALKRDCETMDPLRRAMQGRESPCAVFGK